MSELDLARNPEDLFSCVAAHTSGGFSEKKQFFVLNLSRLWTKLRLGKKELE